METIIKVITRREDYDIRDSMDSSMTIQDVIDYLHTFPMDAKIVMSNDNGFTFAPFREGTFMKVDVETREEEAERERREQEEEDNTHWICPNCNEEDTTICSINGGYQCMECGSKFDKPIIVVNNK